MTRRRTYCAVCRAFHYFDSPDSPSPSQHTTCVEGDPPAGLDLSNGVGRRPLVIGDPEDGFSRHSITVCTTEPGTVVFEYEVDTEEWHHYFEHPVSVAEFLTALGLHKEAAAQELLEACEEALHQLTPAKLVPMDGLDRTRMWLREAIRKARKGDTP